jgi:hypothetical protein
MKLLDDWKHILKKAWSVRLILAAGLLSGVELILPYFSDAIPRGVFAGLSIVVSMAAMYARVAVQKGMSNDPAQ